MILNKEITSKDYKLIPIRKVDIELIREWRNQQMSILRQDKEITQSEQEKYFKDVILKSYNEKRPKLILFSYIHRNKLIGYGGLTNIDWNSKRSELSFLIETERSNIGRIYKKDFETFLVIITKYAFLDLKLNRIFTETFDIREEHVKLLKRNGFMFEGRLRQHICKNGKYIDSLIHGITLDKYDTKK